MKIINMTIFNKNRKYSILTLSPRLNEDREEFWEFRVEDVTEMFVYSVVFGAILWITILLSLINEPIGILYKQFIIMSIQVAGRIIVWLLRKKLKKMHFIHLIGCYYLVS